MSHMKSRVGQCAIAVAVCCLLLPFMGSATPLDRPTIQPNPLLNGVLGDEGYLCDQGYVTEGQIRLFLKYSPLDTITELCASIERLGGVITDIFDPISLIALKIPYENIPQLIALGWQVDLDRQFHACLDQSVPLIKPPATWSQIETFFGYPINGSGITVAVLDTGIEDAHPDLNDLDDNISTTDPKILAQQSFVDGHPSYDDDNGHGTHIAGIIGGTGQDSAGARKGVAPGCWLLNGKVLDSTGVGYESWVLAGMAWAVANGSDVINLSLATAESGNGSDPLSQYVDYIVSQGIPVILAAGKTGSTPYSIARPSVCHEGITVGASSGNTLAAISPWGPTLDFRLKPDLLAPGVGIDSCDDDGSGYVAMSGTSQAAAHVAGAVALLRQAHPTWSPQDIKNTLLSTAAQLNYEPYKQGAGRVNIPAAINTSVLITSQVDFELLGDSIQSKWINLTNCRPYPISVTYAAMDYALNVTNPIALAPFSSQVIQVTTPADRTAHRIWEYVNFTVEGKALHLIACGIHPTITLTVPLNPIRYNEAFNLTIICDVDNYPVKFLETATLEFRVNTSIGWQTYTVPISGNQTVTYPVCDALLYRGVHQVRATLTINNTPLAVQEDLILIQGYVSIILVNNQSGVHIRTLTIPLESGTNASGPLHLYIYLENGWVLLDTVSSASEPFQIRLKWLPRQYTLKVNWTGTETTEPCEVQFTLTLTPNYLIIFLACFGGIAAIMTPLFITRTYRRRREAKARERAAILAECEKERGIKRLAAGLQVEIMGRPTDEPEILESEEPEPDILR